MKLSIKAAVVMMLVCNALGNAGSRHSREQRGSTQPVKLTVFYQLTKSSFDFFNNELYPTYLAVNAYSRLQSKRLAVDLKPFVTFRCSTETEVRNRFLCANTKLHACASSLSSPAILQSDWHRLNYISCVTSSFYDYKIREIQETKDAACVTTTCIDATRLAFCVNSVDGDAILDANFEEFKKLNTTPTEEPVLLLEDRNGVRVINNEERLKGLDNLMGLLCLKFPSLFEGCVTLPRVTSQRQFRFTDKGALQLTRRCDYLRFANQFHD